MSCPKTQQAYLLRRFRYETAQASKLQETRLLYIQRYTRAVTSQRPQHHPQKMAVRLKSMTLKEAYSVPKHTSAICVQSFDDSLNSAIHITYRISLRSSSLREPRYPLLRVLDRFDFVLHKHIQRYTHTETSSHNRAQTKEFGC